MWRWDRWWTWTHTISTTVFIFIRLLLLLLQLSQLPRIGFFGAQTICQKEGPIKATEAGTTLEIGKLDGHQKRLPATIRETLAAYDPGKEKPRS